MKKDTDSSAGRLFDGTCFEITSFERPLETIRPFSPRLQFLPTLRPFLKCVGHSYSNSEIIEVFAWLASTLREASGPNISYSVIRNGKLPRLFGNLDLVLMFTEGPFLGDAEMIEFGTASVSGGNCWHALFNNPVVSKGFPVPLRPPGTPGLEISLEAMGILVGAPRLTIFNNRAVLKGFNAAIFVTACTDETVLWHLHVNKDGSRIRYSDKMVMESLPMEMPSAISSLQGKRHFLGWARDVSYNIGEPLALAT